MDSLVADKKRLYVWLEVGPTYWHYSQLNGRAKAFLLPTPAIADPLSGNGNDVRYLERAFPVVLEVSPLV